MSDKFPHGEYRGYSRHVREGSTICQPCLDARNEYMRNLRRSNMDSRERNRLGNRARSKALWRLADAYPDEFREILSEEYRKEGLL